MTLGWPEIFNKMTEMAKKGLCYQRYSKHLLFLQKLIWSSTRTPAFQTAQVSLKQIEKFLHFSFKKVRNFSNSKPRPPPRGKESWAKTRPPGQWKRTNPRGSPRGGGGGGERWSGLELTDTLKGQTENIKTKWWHRHNHFKVLLSRY